MLVAQRTSRTEKAPQAAGLSVTNGASDLRWLLARDFGHVAGDVLGVLALEQALRHAVLPGAAVLDRVQDALAVDAAELVEVGAGDPVCLDRVEAVAALAGRDEELLALLVGLAGRLGPKRPDTAFGLAATGDHGGRHGHAKPEIEQNDDEGEQTPATGQI